MSIIPKILIVYDESRMCDSMKAMLSNQGYELKTRNSVKEAIECLDNSVFDLVLLDMVMGGENGLTVMDHIISQNLDTLVVIIAGHASAETTIEALRKGAYDYLKKPFEIEELLTTVKNALNQQTMKKAEEELVARVKEQTASLEEMNIALHVLLNKREQDKDDIESKVLSNVKILIKPYLHALKKSSLSKRNQEIIQILETNINEIVAPFTRKMSAMNINLSHMEIQVANLVRQGKTNKEISQVLSIALKTVAFHRNNIRRKLGLTNTKTNLRSFLSALP